MIDRPEGWSHGCYWLATGLLAVGGRSLGRLRLTRAVLGRPGLLEDSANRGRCFRRSLPPAATVAFPKDFPTAVLSLLLRHVAPVGWNQ